MTAWLTSGRHPTLLAPDADHEGVSVTTPGCECLHLGDLAVIDMGDHEVVFRSFDEIRARGAPWWWLYASACHACGQAWLVAQEERQNDVFILRRLDKSAVERLLAEDVWPPDFDRYETLLEIGRTAGKSVRFVDPMDSSLQYTVTDLAKERPGIRVSEIAVLLNLEHDVAQDLARRAAANSGVRITFDAA